ncbi:MAG: hypothetical protein ACHQNV_08065 [Vicinamibacteria bacterium]
MATSPTSTAAVALARRQRNRARGLIVLPMALSAVLLAPAAWVRKAAEVHVALDVRRLHFALGPGGPSELLVGIRARSLTLVGFRELDLGQGRFQADAKAPSSAGSGPAQPIRIAGTDSFSSVTLGAVGLESLSVPGGAGVTLSVDPDEAGSVKLEIDGAQARGRFSRGTPLTLTCAGCSTGAPSAVPMGGAQVVFTAEAEEIATFTGRAEGMALLVEFPPDRPPLLENVPIRAAFDTTEVVEARRVSTIDGGQVEYVDVKRDTLRLERGDFLLLDGLQGFQITSLRVDHALHATLHGRVGLLRAGPGGFVKDRLPSVLEWIYSRSPWILYLQAVILLGTTALGLMRQLKLLPTEGGAP